MVAGDLVHTSQSVGANVPEISVVIPTLDRPRLVARCLRALAQSTLETSRFEVIVVDDGSREPLDAVVRDAQEGLTVQLLRQQQSGPAQARNTGAKAAKGTILAFTDDDCEPAPGWLTQVLQSQRDSTNTVIGGSVCNGASHSVYSETSQVLMDYVYRSFNPDPQHATFFATCNLSIPREPFLAMGGFDSTFLFAAGEDRMFCRRWALEGGCLAYDPVAEVVHWHTLGFQSFFRQHFHYGRGAFRFRKKAAELDGKWIPLERLNFYWGILSAPFHKHSVGEALPMVLLVALSQLAIAAGYFRERIHRA